MPLSNHYPMHTIVEIQVEKHPVSAQFCRQKCLVDERGQRGTARFKLTGWLWWHFTTMMNITRNSWPVFAWFYAACCWLDWLNNCMKKNADADEEMDTDMHRDSVTPIYSYTHTTMHDQFPLVFFLRFDFCTSKLPLETYQEAPTCPPEMQLEVW